MAKKKSKAAQEREGRAEATRYLRRPRMEDASAPSSPVRMQGSAPGEVSELTMDEIRSLNSQGADFASRYGPAVEAYGNMQSMGANLAGAKAGIGPATKPKASGALPPRPEPPHPSTSPPRREVPSYKPTLGQAPPEPPPALPSGREAPKVSRIPRLTENEVRAEWGEPPIPGGGRPNWDSSEADARWKQLSAKTKAASTEAERARQAMERAIEAHRAARQPEVDMSPSATMERALKQGVGRGGQGPGGGAGGGSMDMVQEAAPGDDAQGLTADPKSVLQDYAKLNQAYQGNVTSPAIEENGKAIAEVGAKMAALPPTYKFSRDGIPEGMDMDAEMSRLSALIGKNEASANDIDNYITLQVAQKTAEVRNAGKGKEAPPEPASSDPAPNDVERTKPQPPAAAQAPEAPARSVEGEGAAIRESGSRVVRSGGSGNRGANPPAAAPGPRGGGSSPQPKPPAESPVQPKRPATPSANSGITTGPQLPQPKGNKYFPGMDIIGAPPGTIKPYNKGDFEASSDRNPATPSRGLTGSKGVASSDRNPATPKKTEVIGASPGTIKPFNRGEFEKPSRQLIGASQSEAPKAPAKKGGYNSSGFRDETGWKPSPELVKLKGKVVHSRQEAAKKKKK